MEKVWGMRNLTNANKHPHVDCYNVQRRELYYDSLFVPRNELYVHISCRFESSHVVVVHRAKTSYLAIIFPWKIHCLFMYAQ